MDVRLALSLTIAQREERGTPANAQATAHRPGVSRPARVAVAASDAGNNAGFWSEPVFVAGCSGWLHRPVESVSSRQSDVAVLLCPALGWDGLHGYHGFRLLADQLAASGYPVMRFQYPGTGDSCDLVAGENVAVEHWADWQQSVNTCADWLLASTGAQRLLIIGLRFGATLATVVAERRDDVAGLVLLAPVLRGKSYMRQLDMEARLESGAAADANGGLQFHELNLSAETVGLISAVDLRRARLPAGLKVAMFPQAPSQVVDGCVQSWLGAGVDVQSVTYGGLEPLLQEAIHCDPPPLDFARVLDWARLNLPPAEIARQPGLRLTDPVLELAHCSEVPIRFGDGKRLFGVLCRPKEAVGNTAVIIGNTGRDPHYGIARLGVEFARRLAENGIASFRMDFAGLGDSAAPPGWGDALSSLFEADRASDITAAIDTLERLGYKEFALQGLCSGAYHAWRAAQVETRVGALLLVNLPVFHWRGGDSVKAAIWQSAPASRVLERLADKAVWQRALHGQLALRPILTGFTRQVLDRIAKRLPLWLRRDSSSPSPTRTLQTLANRDVETLFLYSPGDPGLAALEEAFGPEGARLRDFDTVDLRIASDIDHVLSGHDMRARAIGHMVEFLLATPARG